MMQVNVVRGERRRKRMTQAHLAKAAGVSERTVRRMEEGLDVSPESARGICSVLGIDASDLAADGGPGHRRMGIFDFHASDGYCIPSFGPIDAYAGGVELAYVAPGLCGNAFVNEMTVAACLRSLNSTGVMPWLVSFQNSLQDDQRSMDLWRALPDKARKLVERVVLTDGHESTINPFDTPYGLRVPTAYHYESLANILALIVGTITPGPQDLIPDVVAPLLGKAYAMERPYVKGVLPTVDAALQAHPSTWWAAADMLRLAAEPAGLVMAAQRLAVPCPNDLPAIIDELVAEGAFSADVLMIAKSLRRKLPGFLRDCRIFGGATRVPHVESRTVIIDMEGAMKFGREDHRIRGLVYLLARSLLPDARCEGRGQRMTIVDDYHLYDDGGAVEASVLSDARTARERGVRVIVKSQIAETFAGELTELTKLAGVRWGFGSVCRRSAEEAEAILGLDASALRRETVLVVACRDGEEACLSLQNPNSQRWRDDAAAKGRLNGACPVPI